METFHHNGYSYQLVAAKPDDLPRLMELFIAAARWIQSQGSHQWSFFLDGHGAEEVEPGLLRGDIFMLMDGEQIAATVTIHRAPDPWDLACWGEDRGDAAYVHRLAVARSYAGRGLGALLLDWAGVKAKAEGKARLRLDCTADNERLNQFYRDRMEYIGHVTAYGSYEQALYERKL